MTRDLLFNVGVGEIRIAGVKDGKLVRFSLERILDGARNTLVGNIVLGRVEKLVPALDAAFVDIGLERAGFLGAREAQNLGGGAINACVREGETVLLQIAKDPIADKGARLTAALSLAGRLCVLMPNRSGITLSRHIEDEGERARLVQISETLVPEGMGLILRTAAQGASREDLAQDVESLLQGWKIVAEARVTARPPAILHRELGAIARAMRDLVTPDTSRIIFDDSDALAEARDYCRRAMPLFEKKLELVTGNILDDVEDDLESLQNNRVTLAGGGWITIETTEALTAIDINSGSFSAASGREETSLAVNLEAAAEIARQLSLRGIGGLIVVDFIHVDLQKHRDRIVSTLEQALAQDRVPAQVAPMTDLGLVAITRRRTGEPLAKQISTPCLCCSGKGRMPGEATVALAALRRAEREARANPGRAIAVRAAPDVTAWLQSHRDNFMPRLIKRGVSRLELESEPQFAREVFDVRAV